MLNSLKVLILQRNQLLRFAVRDLQRRYLGSVLGLLWAVIQPLTTVAVIWFVFEIGFKVKTIHSSVPFSIWLLTAMIPWFFLVEVLNGSCYSVIEQSGIIKKMVISTELLPMVKVISGLIMHLVFLVIMLIIAVFFGLGPIANWLYILYFLISALVFLFAVALITSSISVFFRDMGQIVALVSQVGFWATPIFWDLAIVPEKYHFFFKLNPVYYITEGYRLSVLGSGFSSMGFIWTAYFWAVSICLLATGLWCFAKLKPHFNEVL
jgi:ABC-type polysaccharide/polyol phosphate export permease